MSKLADNLAGMLQRAGHAAAATLTSPLKLSAGAFLLMNGCLFEAGAENKNAVVLTASLLGIAGNGLGIIFASGKKMVNSALHQSRRKLMVIGERASFGCYLGANLLLAYSGLFMHSKPSVPELLVGAMSIAGNTAALIYKPKRLSTMSAAGRSLLDGKFADAVQNLKTLPPYRVTGLFYWGSVGSMLVTGITQRNPWFLAATPCAAIATYMLGRSTRAELPAITVP